MTFIIPWEVWPENFTTVESRGRKVVVVPYNVPGYNDYTKGHKKFLTPFC